MLGDDPEDLEGVAGLDTELAVVGEGGPGVARGAACAWMQPQLACEGKAGCGQTGSCLGLGLGMPLLLLLLLLNMRGADAGDDDSSRQEAGGSGRVGSSRSPRAGSPSKRGAAVNAPGSDVRDQLGGGEAAGASGGARPLASPQPPCIHPA
jgi:hypothetical protein